MYFFVIIIPIKIFFDLLIVASGLENNQRAPSISPIPPDREVLIPAGIERDTFIQEARGDITRINDLLKVLQNLFNIDPINIELMKDDIDKLKTNEELFQEAFDALESKEKILR